MSNYYTNKMKPIIIQLLEEGLSTNQIARQCNVSLSFVRRVVEGYDMFYSTKNR